MVPSFGDIIKLIKSGASVEAQAKLIDLQSAMIELQEENAALRAKVRELGEPAFPPCPKCGVRAFAVESSKPDGLMGDLGAIRRLYKCGKCGFSESKMEVPN